MEKILDKAIELIQNSQLILSDSSLDGRVNSIHDEDIIIEFLSNSTIGCFVDEPSIRSWYDVAFVDGDKVIYINIKVSNFRNGAADNVSSKLGMGYALTGIENMPMSWEKFNDMLADNLRIGYDYYFLVIDKDFIKNSYWTSLKRIKYLVPNGSNLPFQCDWSKNRMFSGRNEMEAIRYILEVYLSSWDRKTKSYPHKIRDLLMGDKLLDN